MPYYYDPIAYGFSFRTILDSVMNTELKAAFRELLEPVRESIFLYAGFGKPQAKGKQAYGVGLLPHLYPEPEVICDPPHLSAFRGQTIDEALHEWDRAMKAMDDPQCVGMVFGTHERTSRRRFQKNETKYGKAYRELLYQMPEYDTLMRRREDIWKLLSCPSDDLLDVRVPAPCVYSTDLFDVYYEPALFQFPQGRWEKTMADLPEDGKTRYMHTISICIPRFLIGEETDVSALQKRWSEVLCRLGSMFPLSLGSVDMDVSHPSALNAFDEREIFKTGTLWFSKEIPGYSWGMLINATQREKLRILPKEGGPGGFFKVTEFENGNVYFQKTKDWRYMTQEECHALRDFFKPSMSPTALEHWWQVVFPTFRSGFGPEEIEFRPNFGGFYIKHDKVQ